MNNKKITNIVKMSILFSNPNTDIEIGDYKVEDDIKKDIEVWGYLKICDELGIDRNEVEKGILKFIKNKKNVRTVHKDIKEIFLEYDKVGERFIDVLLKIYTRFERLGK